MLFDVVTLFPGLFAGPLQESILGRARRGGTVGIRLHDLRRWGIGAQRQVDDTPYGGGGGMILRPEPFFDAVDWIRREYPVQAERVVLLSPQGGRLTHDSARRLAGFERLILLCGRYEGVDERVREGLADEELSIGDMVLTGGELPAMVAIDAVSRFIPGVLGRKEAAEEDSFARGQLDSPYYTRPPEFRGRAVPEVLLSGDHGAISRWREKKAREATRTKRPDLLEGDGQHRRC
ncbi:MAG: tRNA (guanosine(37)-N1)-methyltransferase TrmD [Acidobacteria bacterium]|nr:tRNA (guanosine(37)-N1)-methyltransferase TrmD [Acidobacteriota bacterium]NIM62076.1 tRNA (guanosine(37)-N1)-methyltransferase TrmD [Acidobacteriota bacterium]NIO59725.1 tRNA (guanosine(37)-N1)-methyltransferase TrmD [Acidobacteriota bacterium]NIQ30814.1 tRNA (guanosine(37)-N1)-methyltransferase TrmD [Acidobacteriota bacterium]NIQ85876.1 tRNA (guanosine(37)-N1)-methyltransferase TrmD [Acidobacteriota bacterium]